MFRRRRKKKSKQPLTETSSPVVTRHGNPSKETEFSAIDIYKMGTVVTNRPNIPHESQDPLDRLEEASGSVTTWAQWYEGPEQIPVSTLDDKENTARSESVRLLDAPEKSDDYQRLENADSGESNGSGTRTVTTAYLYKPRNTPVQRRKGKGSAKGSRNPMSRTLKKVASYHLRKNQSMRPPSPPEMQDFRNFEKLLESCNSSPSSNSSTAASKYLRELWEETISSTSEQSRMSDAASYFHNLRNTPQLGESAFEAHTWRLTQEGIDPRDSRVRATDSTVPSMESDSRVRATDSTAPSMERRDASNSTRELTLSPVRETTASILKDSSQLTADDDAGLVEENDRTPNKKPLEASTLPVVYDQEPSSEDDVVFQKSVPLPKLAQSRAKKGDLSQHRPFKEYEDILEEIRREREAEKRKAKTNNGGSLCDESDYYASEEGKKVSIPLVLKSTPSKAECDSSVPLRSILKRSTREVSGNDVYHVQDVVRQSDTQSPLRNRKNLAGDSTTFPSLVPESPKNDQERKGDDNVRSSKPVNRRSSERQELVEKSVETGNSTSSAIAHSSNSGSFTPRTSKWMDSVKEIKKSAYTPDENQAELHPQNSRQKQFGFKQFTAPASTSGYSARIAGERLESKYLHRKNPDSTAPQYLSAQKATVRRVDDSEESSTVKSSLANTRDDDESSGASTMALHDGMSSFEPSPFSLPSPESQRGNGDHIPIPIAHENEDANLNSGVLPLPFQQPNLFHPLYETRSPVYEGSEPLPYQHFQRPHHSAHLAALDEFRRTHFPNLFPGATNTLHPNVYNGMTAHTAGMDSVQNYQFVDPTSHQTDSQRDYWEPYESVRPLGSFDSISIGRDEPSVLKHADLQYGNFPSHGFNAVPQSSAAPSVQSSFRKDDSATELSPRTLETVTTYSTIKNGKDSRRDIKGRKKRDDEVSAVSDEESNPGAEGCSFICGDLHFGVKGWLCS